MRKRTKMTSYRKLTLAAILTTGILLMMQIFLQLPGEIEPESTFNEPEFLQINCSETQLNCKSSGAFLTESKITKALVNKSDLDGAEDLKVLLQRLVARLNPEHREDLIEYIGRHGRKKAELKSLTTPFVNASSRRPETPMIPKSLNTAPGEIPKILHQTYSTERLPDTYKPMIEKCLRLNPDWKYYLWTDKDFDVLMARHFSDMLKTVKQFKHRLERADSLRYVVLFIFGGVYIDMDVDCQKPFYPTLSKHSAFLDQEHPLHANILHGKSFTAMNSAMGAKAAHPFFKQTIDKVVSQKYFGSPVESTGPLMLTRQLEEYKKSQDFKDYPIDLLPHYTMSPEVDVQQNWREICTKNRYLENGRNKIKDHKARELNIREESCIALEENGWKVASDVRPDTVAVHKFMHLGYPEIVKARGIKILSWFNATEYFKPLIHSYCREEPLTSLEILNVLTQTVL